MCPCDPKHKVQGSLFVTCIVKYNTQWNVTKSLMCWVKPHLSVIITFWVILFKKKLRDLLAIGNYYTNKLIKSKRNVFLGITWDACLNFVFFFCFRFYQFQCSVCTKGPETIQRLPMTWWFWHFDCNIFTDIFTANEYEQKQKIHFKELIPPIFGNHVWLTHKLI